MLKLVRTESCGFANTNKIAVTDCSVFTVDNFWGQKFSGTQEQKLVMEQCESLTTCFCLTVTDPAGGCCAHLSAEEEP